jgi:hypothetical protein
MTPVPDDRVKRLHVLKGLPEHAIAESRALELPIVAELICAATLDVWDELKAHQVPAEEES